MSSGQANIVYVSADRQLKVDYTKSGPGNMSFVTAALQLKIDIATLTDLLCIFHR